MNDDLISRQAVIDMLAQIGNYDDHDVYVVNYNDVITALVFLPSVQPEVIRCKDCLLHGACRFEQGLGLDGYCSQAEKRTDG